MNDFIKNVCHAVEALDIVCAPLDPDSEGYDADLSQVVDAALREFREDRIMKWHDVGALVVVLLDLAHLLDTLEGELRIART